LRSILGEEQSAGEQEKDKGGKKVAQQRHFGSMSHDANGKAQVACAG
jgi:hypothetical protein